MNEGEELEGKIKKIESTINFLNALPQKMNRIIQVSELIGHLKDHDFEIVEKGGNQVHVQYPKGNAVMVPGAGPLMLLNKRRNELRGSYFSSAVRVLTGHLEKSKNELIALRG